MASQVKPQGEADGAEQMDLIRGPRAGWESYLQSLAAPRGPLSPFLGKQVLDLWNCLERSLGAVGAVASPHAAVTPDRGFSMTWDRGRHHFEVEIGPVSSYGWFYMDRESDQRSGEEDRPLGSCSAEMIAALRRTVG